MRLAAKVAGGALVDAWIQRSDVDSLRTVGVSDVGVKACFTAGAPLAAVIHVAARGCVQVGVHVTRRRAPREHNAQLSLLHGGGHSVGAGDGAAVEDADRFSELWLQQGRDRELPAQKGAGC